MNVQELAKEYLADLEANYLEVVLIPSRDPACAIAGGMIRAVQYENARWYKLWAASYESTRKNLWKWRKFKTKVKRQDTIRGLKELIDGKSDTIYAKELEKFIKRHGRDVLSTY